MIGVYIASSMSTRSLVHGVLLSSGRGGDDAGVARNFLLGGAKRVLGRGHELATVVRTITTKRTC